MEHELFGPGFGFAFDGVFGPFGRDYLAKCAASTAFEIDEDLVVAFAFSPEGQDQLGCPFEDGQMRS